MSIPTTIKVIPTLNDRSVIVNKEEFIHTVRRMAILSSEKFKGITLELSDSSMKISSNNPELGNAMEEVDVAYAGDFLTVKFNARYMLDAITIIDDENIVMKFRDELSPIIIVSEKPSTNINVVMSMRL